MITDLYLARLCQSAYDPGASWDSRWTQKSVYVYCRKVVNTYAIVFRGSDNLTDWLDNLKGWPSHHKDLGFCHTGFLEDMDVVVGEVLALVNGHPIVITGHSLGAARALILGALLTVLGVKPQSIVVFGSPRPGAGKLKKVLLDGGFPIRSYRNRSDPVCDVPYVMMRKWLPDFGIYQQPVDFTPLDVFDWRESGIKEHGIDLYVKGLSP